MPHLDVDADDSEILVQLRAIQDQLKDIGEVLAMIQAVLEAT